MVVDFCNNFFFGLAHCEKIYTGYHGNIPDRRFNTCFQFLRFTVELLKEIIGFCFCVFFRWYDYMKSGKIFGTIYSRLRSRLSNCLVFSKKKREIKFECFRKKNKKISASSVARGRPAKGCKRHILKGK